jgi:hypothetical protein
MLSGLSLCEISQGKKQQTILPPRPTNKFTETFKVVVFYKKPSRNYYQDSKLFGLPSILIEILKGSLNRTRNVHQASGVRHQSSGIWH